MDSILNKMLDSLGIKDKILHRRQNDRYYDEKYRVYRKSTSSTTSSRSSDDETHYIEKNGITVEKVEDLVSQMFESCTVNMKGMFNQPPSPRGSDRKDRHRLKSENDHNATIPYYRNKNYNGMRESRSGLGVSQKKRGRRSMSRKRRSVSRPRRRTPLPDNTPLPGNKTMLIVQNDDDEVSALSAGTLEEMATRQQRLKRFYEANRKSEAACRPSYPQNNYSTTLEVNRENVDSIQVGKLQNIAEDLKSFQSVSSANTTEFESIWKEHPVPTAPAPTQRAGIYEKRHPIPEEATLDAVQKLRELDTPLSRKLRRYQVSQAIEEIDNDEFSLRPYEQEI